MLVLDHQCDHVGGDVLGGGGPAPEGGADGAREERVVVVVGFMFVCGAQR